jgi:glycosyltransferase involved in cell wall biosynthesis
LYNIPKITVVIVSFNSGATIEDTIISVKNQNYSNIECIVVDGLSTDNTLDILNKYFNVITKVISENDTGIYDAMNKGIINATGDIVGLLNSDDVLADNFVLKRVSEVFLNNQDIDACYGDLCYVKQNDLSKIVRYWRSNNFKNGLFKYGWVPPHPTLYVRSKIYKKYGGFDTSYMIAADFELMLRLFEVFHIHSAYLPHVLVKMRLGGTSNRSIKNIIVQNMEIRRALRNHKIQSSLIAFIALKTCSRVLQFLKRPK